MYPAITATSQPPCPSPDYPGRRPASRGITFGLVLMILNMANGPKLNGPFVALAVGAYIMAWGTMGGPYDGAET